MFFTNLKILKYSREKESYPLETRLFVTIQFGLLLVFFFTFIAESFLQHYPEAWFIWTFGITIPFISIEMILKEKLVKLVYSVNLILYTALIFLGLYLSGSILTPSVLYSFLGLLIVSVVARGFFKYLSIILIIGAVIGHSISEMKSEKIKYIYSDIYIDWAVYFTIIALVVVWIISRMTIILQKYDEEVKNAHDQLYYNSITDPLTELFNRNYLEEYTNEIFNNKRMAESLNAVLMVDIDFFKKYNDYYGHIKGDDCLRGVAKVLKKSLYRKEDMIFRIGGEEFLLFMGGLDERSFNDINERIHNQLAEEKIEHKDSPISPYVTISMGAVLFDINENRNLDEIFNLADAALYQAKNSGRNRSEKVILLPK